MGVLEVFLEFVQSSNSGVRPWHGEGEWFFESAPNDWGVRYYEILFREKDMWRVVIFKSETAPDSVPTDARILIESPEYELCVKYMLCGLYSDWRLSRSWDLIHWFFAEDEAFPRLVYTQARRRVCDPCPSGWLTHSDASFCCLRKHSITAAVIPCRCLH